MNKVFISIFLFFPFFASIEAFSMDKTNNSSSKENYHLHNIAYKKTKIIFSSNKIQSYVSDCTMRSWLMCDIA